MKTKVGDKIRLCFNKHEGNRRAWVTEKEYEVIKMKCKYEGILYCGIDILGMFYYTKSWVRV